VNPPSRPPLRSNAEGIRARRPGQCSGGRGAGAIGGWPEPRHGPEAFRIAVHSGAVRGAGAIGGWPEPRHGPEAFRIAVHSGAVRGAGVIGGWPEPRHGPEAFRMSLLIPSGSASPVRPVGVR